MIKQKILPFSKDMVLSLKLRSKLSKKKSLKKNASLITISFFLAIPSSMYAKENHFSLQTKESAIVYRISSLI